MRTAHHCYDCGRQRGHPRCYELNHLAFCEQCGHDFATRFGCTVHSYRQGYNLDKQRNREAIDRRDAVREEVREEGAEGAEGAEHAEQAGEIRGDENEEPANQQPANQQPTNQQPANQQRGRRLSRVNNEDPMKIAPAGGFNRSGRSPCKDTKAHGKENKKGKTG